MCLFYFLILLSTQPNEVELGLGIHGEPGVQRMQLKSVDAFVDQILETILQKSPPFLASPPPAHVVLLINNLGGTTSMEVSIAAKRAVIFLGKFFLYYTFFVLNEHFHMVLEQKKLTVERVYTGPFMTALDMAGLSFTLLPVKDIDMPLYALSPNICVIAIKCLF